MATIIRQRRDTAANWVINDSVIPNGQLCVDTTDNTLKVGDGVTLYSALKPMNSDLAGVVDAATARSNLGITSANVPCSAVGNLSATNLQAAIQELDTEKEPADGTILKNVSIGITVQGYNSVLDSTTASFTTAEEGKLASIQAGAKADQTKADIDALDINAGSVDGINGSSLLRSDVEDSLTAAIVVPTGSRDKGMFGTYDATKTQHIWSMGTAYTNSSDGTDYGNLHGLAYKNNAMGGGHCVNVVVDGVEKASLGNNIWASGNILGYSDIRVKSNIEVIPNALDKVGRLSGYTFDRTDTEDVKRQTGVIAQEVLKVLPEAVSGSEEGHYSVAYGNMVGILIEAIKELHAKVKTLESK